MKHRMIAVLLAASVIFPMGGMAQASDGGILLGRILTGAISRSQRHTSRKTSTPASASRRERYKNAMGALENLQWVGVAKSSGGNIYFDQDTLKDTSRYGERRVVATMKNEFTKAGAEAVAKSSDGMLDKDDVSYSLFLVDFGERSCFVASSVTYYDKKGKRLAVRAAGDAFADVTGMSYGRPYRAGSMEEEIKNRVFHYADRVKQEEKEKAEQNR